MSALNATTTRAIECVLADTGAQHKPNSSADFVRMNDAFSLRKTCERLLREPEQLTEALIEHFDLGLRASGAHSISVLPHSILVNALHYACEALNDIGRNAGLYSSYLDLKTSRNLEVTLDVFKDSVACIVWFIIQWPSRDWRGLPTLFSESGALGKNITGSKVNALEQAVWKGKFVEQPIFPTDPRYKSHARQYAAIKGIRSVINNRKRLFKTTRHSRAVIAGMIDAECPDINFTAQLLIEKSLEVLGFTSASRKSLSAEPNLVGICSVFKEPDTYQVYSFIEHNAQLVHEYNSIADLRGMLRTFYPLSDIKLLENSIKSSAVCDRIGNRNCPKNRKLGDNANETYRDARRYWLDVTAYPEDDHQLCKVERLLNSLSPCRKPPKAC
ncbi:hypothetical protein MNBD_GAMMA15-406 [hydrothermal vent metagenome]|uniref:Uncharacterized protein n=1 Tax=hydrothermal vent metagenome TaxID=652676 RepID=A0A3B0YC92_9ZZZZ